MPTETNETRQVVVPPVNPYTKLLKDWWPVALLLLVFAQQFGWLTPVQTDAIKKLVEPLIAAKADETTKETDAKIEAKHPEQPVAAISADDLKKWMDLLNEILKVIPKPEPKPPTPTPPKPVDPIPVPVPPIIDPMPSPVGPLKIVLSDKLGQPITSSSVEAGRWFRISANGATGDIDWTITSASAPEIGPCGHGAEYSGVLKSGEWLQVKVTDWQSRKTAEMRVTCLVSPNPPPGPIPPHVDPLPTPTATQVSLAVVYDAKAITPSTAVILNATQTWQAFSAAGNSWRFYDRSTSEVAGKTAVADVGTTPQPALVIYDKTSGVKLESMPLPKSIDDLKSAVAKHTGGKP